MFFYLKLFWSVLWDSWSKDRVRRKKNSILQIYDWEELCTLQKLFKVPSSSSITKTHQANDPFSCLPIWLYKNKISSLLMLKGKSHPRSAFVVNQLSLFYSLVNKQMRQLGFIFEIIRKELRWTWWNFKSILNQENTCQKRETSIFIWQTKYQLQDHYGKTELIL